LVYLDVVLFACLLFFFFFQAEDGIRDDLVTGVQTCALPIFKDDDGMLGQQRATQASDHVPPALPGPAEDVQALSVVGRRYLQPRSEERRVGKECRSRRWR